MPEPEKNREPDAGLQVEAGEGGAEAEAPIVEADLTEEEAAELASVEGVADLWAQYQVTPSADLSRKLVDKYLPFVRSMGQRFNGHLPNCVDVDDLVQDGTLGLLDAIDAYEPERGIKFETFSGRRIKGAMLDGLRGMDWVARLDRQRSGTFNAARNQLVQETGRAPTDEELAAKLEMSPEAFNTHRLAARNAVNHRHAGDFRPRFKSGDAEEEPLSLDSALAPRSHAGITVPQELAEIVVELVRGLDQQPRDILNLYLYEELSLKEIGEFLDLSESRVSQLFTQTLQFIAERISAGRFLPHGTVLRELIEEYGDIKGIGGTGAGDALPQGVIELLRVANAAAPVQFQLTGGKEGFAAEDRPEGFDKLVKRIADRQAATRTPPPATSDNSGFTFFDGPAQEE